MTALPGGTVTFLFSDIEGSTRLVKALRERYADVLAEHRGLVRAAVAGHGGHEVDTQGDAFFIAFGGAKQAVLCAVEIQRALAAQLVVRTLSRPAASLRIRPGRLRCGGIRSGFMSRRRGRGGCRGRFGGDGCRVGLARGGVRLEAPREASRRGRRG